MVTKRRSRLNSVLLAGLSFLFSAPPVAFPQENSLYYNKGGELTQPNATKDWNGPAGAVAEAIADGRYGYAIAVATSALNRRPADPAAARLHRLRGDAYFANGDVEKAQLDYRRAINFTPKKNWDYTIRGHAHERLRNYAAAAADYNKAVELAPEDEEILNVLAWFRATCPEGPFRNGREAVRLATKACELSRWRNGDILDTLAAAEAEAGNFDAAAQRQEQAMKRSAQEDWKEMQERLALYRSRRPYRDTRIGRRQAAAGKIYDRVLRVGPLIAAARRCRR